MVHIKKENWKKNLSTQLLFLRGMTEMVTGSQSLCSLLFWSTQLTYISQSSMQLGMAKWLISRQWDVGRCDVCRFRAKLILLSLSNQSNSEEHMVKAALSSNEWWRQQSYHQLGIEGCKCSHRTVTWEKPARTQFEPLYFLPNFTAF